MVSLLGWDILGVVGICLALGFGVLEQQSYRWAKFWFTAAAAIPAVKLVFVTTPAWPDAGWALLACAVLGILLLVAFRGVDNRELRDSTRLRPGRLPTPQIPPHPTPAFTVPANALMVFMGTNVAWSTRMPHTILQMGGKQILRVDRDRRGLVLRVLRIFDDSNRIIARIDEDGFWVEPYTRSKRPDRSTLVIYDRTDTEVLRVSLLNRRAVEITGVFRSEGSQTMVVTPDSIRVGTTTLRRCVSGENEVDFNV